MGDHGFESSFSACAFDEIGFTTALHGSIGGNGHGDGSRLSQLKTGRGQEQKGKNAQHSEWVKFRVRR